MASGRSLLRLATGWRGTLDYLRQQSLIEGMWNGRRSWLAVGALVWGARGLSKALRREEKVVLREVLRPGETYIVTEAISRPTRRQRRRAK
jgi:hypothetical protein